MSTSSILCAQVRTAGFKAGRGRSREGRSEIGTWQAGFESEERFGLQPHSTQIPTRILPLCAGAPFLSSLASASSPVEWV